jgi:hypothetical protein
MIAAPPNDASAGDHQGRQLSVISCPRNHRQVGQQVEGDDGTGFGVGLTKIN